MDMTEMGRTFNWISVYDVFGFESCEIVIQNLKKETKKGGDICIPMANSC